MERGVGVSYRQGVVGRQGMTPTHTPKDRDETAAGT
jgi:hypothetical protein